MAYICFIIFFCFFNLRLVLKLAESYRRSEFLEENSMVKKEEEARRTLSPALVPFTLFPCYVSCHRQDVFLCGPAI